LRISLAGPRSTEVGDRNGRRETVTVGDVTVGSGVGFDVGGASKAMLFMWPFVVNVCVSRNMSGAAADMDVGVDGRGTWLDSAI